MILYNVTVSVDTDIAGEWKEWIKSTYIPMVMDTGYFFEHRIFKVLSHDDEGTESYSVQFFSPSLDMVVQYLNKDSERIFREHHQRYLNRHVAFQTMLEEVV